ncbi:hypothetical protein LZ554_002858 [Drepanopeziza brunnea f. sp. 'monogermtubi']|nr:hypothetical protein LZ554_002858 [Drepanopeziza brunnea f. sp. 'monogermtubi']
MSGGIDADPDFEFFNSNLENSPDLFFAEDLVTENSQFLPDFGTPDTADRKSQLLPVQNSSLGTTPQPSRGAPPAPSPAAWYLPSAAFSGSKRKSSSSSDSSGSALTSADVVMMADADMVDWKFEEGIVSTDAKIYGGLDGTINPAAMGNFDFIDKAMEKVFDFDSAASSPSPFAMGPVDSPEVASGKEDRPRRRHSPTVKSKSMQHNKRDSQYSITQSMNGLTTAGSREASPLAMVTRSQESSPAAFFNNSPSPGNTVSFMSAPHMTSGPLQNPGWAAGFGGFNNGPPAMQRALNPHPTPGMSLYQPPAHMAPPPPLEPLLTIHPTPLKSRVETQIPITMIISNVPAGVTKVHLPTHCISKPKLLARPTPARSPDTLELDVNLVLSSAMANPENRRRAFERAAAGRAPSVQVESSPGESGADEDDENKPSNGGDVEICPGCITRERKRAARKKVKKVEEEESWHRDEAKRVIVFNTHEVKEWQAPTSQPLAEATGDRPEPLFAEGSMQVDIPMRIACYCRHQNEKVGFQVIFTLKDYQGRVIAQTITSSIMITDDHKTHNMPQMANESDGQMFSGPGPFSAEFPLVDMSAAPPGNLPPFRLSQSNADSSQGMPSNFHTQFPPPLPPGVAPSSHVSQANAVSATPRNMSRPPSPSLPHGRTAKKRKPSGSNKLPSGLVMTRLETGDTAVGPGPPTGPSSANTSSAPSPFTPNFSTFTLTDQQHYHPQPPPTIATIPRQYHTGPPTPNGHDQAFFSNGNRSQSMENLAMHQLYSTPASAHPSRVPSPSNGMRGTVQAYQEHQAKIAQAVANGLSGVPLALDPRRPPKIHKLVHPEGPKSGGIEVSVLGSGFCAGLEVMFGDSIATTTTFWGRSALVCLLPPADEAGTVPVTFKHQHPQHQQQQINPYATPPMPKQNVFFKYVDDDEQQMIRVALSVLDHKMTGRMDDARDLARRILRDGPSSWYGPNGPPLPGCGGGGGFMGPLN